MIIAFALLAVGLAAVVVIMGQGQYHNSLSDKNDIALTLAKERLESIRNKPYSSVIAVPVPTAFDVPNPNYTVYPEYTEYYYQILVTTFGALPGQIKDVIVNVSYKIPGQTTNPVVSLETYVGNY